jgi:hypothetical protein
LKLFVTLNEVTDQHGPLHVISKRKTKELFSSGFSRSDPQMQEKVNKVATPVSLTGPPGTAMLANTNTVLHRAGHPAKGKSRDIALIQLVPATEPLPENWLSELDYNRTGRPIF